MAHCFTHHCFPWTDSTEYKWFLHHLTINNLCLCFCNYRNVLSSVSRDNVSTSRALLFISWLYVVGTRFFLHRDERLPNALSVQHKTVLWHKYLPEYVWTCCFSWFHMKGYADIQTLRQTGKVISIDYRISVENCRLWAWLSEVMFGF